MLSIHYLHIDLSSPPSPSHIIVVIILIAFNKVMSVLRSVIQNLPDVDYIAVFNVTFNISKLLIKKIIIILY